MADNGGHSSVVATVSSLGSAHDPVEPSSGRFGGDILRRNQNCTGTEAKLSKNICWIRLYEKIDQASFSLSLLGKGLNYAIIKEKQCSQVTN